MTAAQRFAYFDVSTGTVVQNISGGFSTIVDEGNGWYRCSVSQNLVAGDATGAVQLLFIDSGVNTFYTGNGTSGLFLWGGQLEVGDIATPYIATTTTAVSVGPVSGLPRLDYLNSTCPRLLLEPQRTNLITFSEQFNNAAWVTVNATITANAIASPDGSVNADLFTATAGANRIGANSTSTGSNTITYSVFVKKGTQNVFRIREAFYFGSSAIFNLNTGTLTSGTGTITPYGNDWYRCTLTQAYGVGQVSLSVIFDTTAASGTFYLYGAQAEVGAYATSYIPTLGTSVTRVVDAASKTGISSLIGQTEGTIFIDFEYNQTPPDANGRLLQLWGTNDTTDSILPLILGAGASANQFQLTTFNATTVSLPIAASAGTTVPFGRQKFAIAYNAGVYTVYRNGSLFASGSGLAPVSLTALDLGGSAFFDRNLGNPINQALIFKTRLSNSDLATLTTL
jgi:hypothetical protein